MPVDGAQRAAVVQHLRRDVKPVDMPAAAVRGEHDPSSVVFFDHSARDEAVRRDLPELRHGRHVDDRDPAPQERDVGAPAVVPKDRADRRLGQRQLSGRGPRAGRARQAVPPLGERAAPDVLHLIGKDSVIVDGVLAHVRCLVGPEKIGLRIDEQYGLGFIHQRVCAKRDTLNVNANVPNLILGFGKRAVRSCIYNPP